MAPAPYRLRIPSRLSVSTAPIAARPGLRAVDESPYELRVVEFLDQAKCNPRDRAFHYFLKGPQSDRRAGQILRSMRMMKQVGWSTLQIGKDAVTAVLSVTADGFSLATPLSLQGPRSSEQFSRRCTVLIDSETKGLHRLFLSDEAANQTTQTGDSGEPGADVARFVDAEVDRLLEGMREPIRAAKLIIRG